MDVADIIQEIKKINDISGLRLIERNIKNQIERAAQTVEWFVGQKVQLLPQYHSRKPYSNVGTITKVNQKKLKINFGKNLFIWSIPKSMVQEAENETVCS